MLKKLGSNDIKIEYRDEGNEVIESRNLEYKRVKVEYDSREFPPVVWASLKPRGNPNPNPNPNLFLKKVEPKDPLKITRVKAIRKIALEAFRDFVPEEEFQSFMAKFKKYKHTDYIFFAMLMHTLLNLEYEKATYEAIFKEKINRPEYEHLFTEEQIVFHCSLVNEFLNGDPASVITVFYQKYQHGSKVPPKPAKLLKTLEKYLTEDFTSLEIELESSSYAQFEGESISRQKKDEQFHQMKSEVNSLQKYSKQSSLPLNQSKLKSNRSSYEPLLIYKKDDPLKAGLYHIDPNFTLQSCLKDLIPAQ